MSTPVFDFAVDFAVDSVDCCSLEISASAETAQESESPNIFLRHQGDIVALQAVEYGGELYASVLFEPSELQGV